METGMGMLNIEHILESHKYLPYIVLLIWTFLEGESIVILAGIAAKEGDLSLPLIILCAFCGSLCSDQLMFFFGRYRGQSFVAKRPSWQVRAVKVYRLLEVHQTWFILGFRFLYGLRNISPFVIGMSEIKTRRFVILNVLGAALGAVWFAGGGYRDGAATESFLGKKNMVWIVLAIVAIATITWIVRLIRRRTT